MILSLLQNKILTTIRASRVQESIRHVTAIGTYQNTVIMRKIVLSFITKNNKKQTPFNDHAHLKELEQAHYICLFTSGLCRRDLNRSR